MRSGAQPLPAVGRLCLRACWRSVANACRLAAEVDRLRTGAL